MVDWEWDSDSIPLAKLILHIIQIALSFVIWCLEIAVFRGGEIKGKNGWTFGVCFLSVPAWIYLCMAPRFPKTRRLANPVAMLIVDFCFTVIWLSAFATQASYTSAGSCGNACGPSKAIIWLGVFVFLFFCGTTFLSFSTLRYAKWNDGRLPGYDNLRTMRKTPLQNIDPDKAAFSMAPPHDEEYGAVPMHDHDADPRPGDDYDTSYGGGAAAAYSSPPATNAPAASTIGSYAGRSAANPYGSTNSRLDNPFDSHHGQYDSPDDVGRRFQPSPAHSGGYDDDRPAQFPVGNYDRLPALGGRT